MQRRVIYSAIVFALPFFMFVFSLPAVADDTTFGANSRVEGRIGSQWSRCTTVGERRPTGGYLLRCDALPGQESVFAASDVRAMQSPDRAPAEAAPKPQLRHAPPAVAPAVESPVVSSPRVGVYGCMNQDALDVPQLQFGLLDATTYSTATGDRGRYRYSAKGGILTFTSGPFAGLRRSRETERTFRVLDEHGTRTAFLCPLTSKDPRKTW